MAGRTAMNAPGAPPSIWSVRRRLNLPSPPQHVSPPQIEIRRRTIATPPVVPPLPPVPDVDIPTVPEEDQSSGIRTPPPQPEVTDVSWPDHPLPQETLPPESSTYSSDEAGETAAVSRLVAEDPSAQPSDSPPLDPAIYKLHVQQQLTREHPRVVSEDNIGYLDGHGYVVEWKQDSEDTARAAPESRGEATYFTAVALVALAAGNYNQDAWETESANAAISRFLDVLLTKSWGNKDSSGQLHPIRHPDWVEVAPDGTRRNRPLTKDSFGQIVLGCYYAYKCPSSSGEVRQKAQELLDKWIDYLDRHKWLLHSNYIPNEFASHVIHPDPPGSKSKTVFDNLVDEHGNPITALGAESFALTPPELFALKNCAEAIGINRRVIDPTIGFAISFGQGPVAHWQDVIEPVVVEAGKAMDWLFDRLVYQRNYSFHAIPGWKESLIKGTLAISPFGPTLTKAAARESFEWQVRNFLLSILPDPTLSTSYEAGLAEMAAKFAMVDDSALYGVPFIGIFYELIKQLCPWFGENLLVEYFWFAAAISAYMGRLPALKLDSDSPNIGYFFWTVLAEMEAQPALVPLLKPLVKQLFDFLASKKDNPNTLWAWLAGRNTVVQEHMTRFESITPQNWVQYAYSSSDYNKWVTEEIYVKDTGPLPSSRVDYLVLQGLREKGHPKPWSVNISMATFTDACSKALETYIKGIRDKVLAGGFEQQYVDALGNTIVEHIPLSGPIVRTIRFLTGEKVNLIYQTYGAVERWHVFSSDTLRDVKKWRKMAGDGIAHARDLDELQVLDPNNVFCVWRWIESDGLLEFNEYLVRWARGFDVGTSDAIRKLTLLRDVNDHLLQWRYAESALQKFTEWSTSTLEGWAGFKDCIEHRVGFPGGNLRQWKFHPQGILAVHKLWDKSVGDMEPVVEELVMSAFRELDGELDISHWAKGALKTRQIWWASGPMGLPLQGDKVFQVRSLEGVLEEWELDADDVFIMYRIWAVSTADGVAEAKDLVKSIEKKGTRFIQKTFKDGEVVAKQVVDAVGDVISDVGGAVGDAVGDVGEAVGDAVGDVGEAVGNVVGNVGGAIRDAVGSIGRIRF